MTAKDIQKQWITDALTSGKPKGKTQKGLAKALGLDQSQGHRIANGRRLLNFAEVALVEHYLGKRAPRAIASGMEFDSHEGAILRDAPRLYGAPDDGFVDVPVFEQRIPPGADVPPGNLTPISLLKFPEAALRAITANVRGLYALEISGDATRPFLQSGDHALVDPGQTNPSREGRYIVRVDDELQVKLITMNLSSRLLTVKSDNPDYPSYDNIRLADLDIAGRVIWIARRLV